MRRIVMLTATALAEAKAGVRKVLPRHFVEVAEEEFGATAIEYGLIGAGIAVAIIGIVFILGNDIAELFEAVSDKLKSKTPT